jgi:hypothetical protein
LSVTSRPPAAIAAARRASAWSCGTQTSMWIRLRCGRGASVGEALELSAIVRQGHGLGR